MANTLYDFAVKASKTTKTKSQACKLTITEDDETFEAYEVSISSCDLLFFTDKGTLNYLVDIYGDRVTFELYNIDRDSDDDGVPHGKEY